MTATLTQDDLEVGQFYRWEYTSHAGKRVVAVGRYVGMEENIGVIWVLFEFEEGTNERSWFEYDTRRKYELVPQP